MIGDSSHQPNGRMVCTIRYPTRGGQTCRRIQVASAQTLGEIRDDRSVLTCQLRSIYL